MRNAAAWQPLTQPVHCWCGTAILLATQAKELHLPGNSTCGQAVQAVQPPPLTRRLSAHPRRPHACRRPTFPGGSQTAWSQRRRWPGSPVPPPAPPAPLPAQSAGAGSRGGCSSEQAPAGTLLIEQARGQGSYPVAQHHSNCSDKSYVPKRAASDVEQVKELALACLGS